jgi:hypothetical protein
MGRKRNLKKVCCDSEVEEQNIVALEMAIEEQNVVPSKLTIGEQNVVKIEEPKVDETSNQCNLKWTW